MKKILLIIFAIVSVFLISCSQPQLEPTAKEDITPSVSVGEQKLVDDSVTVSSVVAEEDGWLVIHADNDGKPGEVLGHTQVHKGLNIEVTIAIDGSKAVDFLHAMLHVDKGTSGVFDFPGDDAPVKLDEAVVNKRFSIE